MKHSIAFVLQESIDYENCECNIPIKCFKTLAGQKKIRFFTLKKFKIN